MDPSQPPTASSISSTGFSPTAPNAFRCVRVRVCMCACLCVCARLFLQTKYLRANVCVLVFVCLFLHLHGERNMVSVCASVCVRARVIWHQRPAVLVIPSVIQMTLQQQLPITLSAQPHVTSRDVCRRARQRRGSSAAKSSRPWSCCSLRRSSCRRSTVRLRLTSSRPVTSRYVTFA